MEQTINGHTKKEAIELAFKLASKSRLTFASWRDSRAGNLRKGQSAGLPPMTAALAPTHRFGY